MRQLPSTVQGQQLTPTTKNNPRPPKPSMSKVLSIFQLKVSLTCLMILQTTKSVSPSLEKIQSRWKTTHFPA